MRTVHDRARCHGELVLAALALPAVVLFEVGHVHITAAEASHAARPAQGFQVFPALLVGAESVNQLHEVHHGSGSETEAKAA